MKTTKNHHTFGYYALLFFLLAFIGWLWEVALFWVTDHALINRGVYRGPYLPIYGVGGLLLCLLLQQWRKKPVLVFGLSMLLCSVLEYFTSYILEKRWGIRWWDYSGHFLNLQGRICLAGAVIFGLGGTLLVCLLLPYYEKWYERIPRGWRLGVTLSLLLIFVLDATYSAVRPNTGEGISEGAEFASDISLPCMEFAYLNAKPEFSTDSLSFCTYVPGPH